MREDILKRTNVDNIIDLLQMELEVSQEGKANYQQVRKEQLTDLEESLREKLPQQERDMLLDDIQDFENLVAEEHLRVGFKVGVKLMNELARL